MSTSSADAVRELRREMASLRREFAGVLRLQYRLIMDCNRVVLQTTGRLEIVENYLNNPSGRFNSRYEPEVSRFMSELSRHQGQNGQNQARGRERPVLRANENNADGEMMVVELSHQQGTSGSNFHARATGAENAGEEEVIIVEPSSQQGTSSGIQNGITGFHFDPRVDRQFNLARERMLEVEAEERRHERIRRIGNLHRRQRQQEQQQVNQQQQQQNAVFGAVQQQQQQDPLFRAVQEQQQRQNGNELLGRMQKIEDQLVEVELFYTRGWPLFPDVRLIHEENCVICLREGPMFYSNNCGHVALCSRCSVDALIREVVLCPICRAPLQDVRGEPTFRFYRPRGWWKRDE